MTERELLRIPTAPDGLTPDFQIESYEMLEPLHSTVQAQILVILLLTTFLQIPGVFTNPQQTSSEVSFTHHHELPHRDGNSLSTDTSLVSAQSTISGYISSPTKLDVDFNLKTRPTAVYRPRRLEGIDHARPIATRRTARNQELEASVDEVNVYTNDDPSDVDSDWDIVHLNGPDVQDLHTLAQLARMSGNAYALGPSEKNWYELDGAWNIVRFIILLSFNAFRFTCILIVLPHSCRVFLSATRTRRTASGVMYSSPPTIRRSCSLLRARLYKARHRRRTNSMIICKPKGPLDSTHQLN